jgi:hypothetical protein
VRSRRVYVSEGAECVVRDMADAAAPFETGGVLVGVATPDGVWVTEFATIAGRTRHHARFLIPAWATHAAVDAARRIDARMGYLGDWHTHPADVRPSGVDFATLRDLAVGPFGSRRLLGLVRRVGPGWDLTMWALDRWQTPVRVAFERIGPVPTED